MRRAFILGAGFSKDIAGFPVLDELSLKVRARLEQIPESPISHYLKTSVPSRVKSNIELLLTFLLQDFPWRNDTDGHLANAAYPAVAGAIRAVLEHHEEKEELERAPECLSKLLHHWHRQECNILTLNYDTLVERLSAQYLKKKREIYTIADGANLRSMSRLEVQIESDMPQPRDIAVDVVAWDSVKRELRLSVPSRGTPFDVVRDSLSRKCVPGQAGPDPNEVRDWYERAIQSLSSPIFPDDMYQVPVADVARRTLSLYNRNRTETFHYYKLHGSMNWLFSGTPGFSAEQIYSTPLGKQLDDPNAERNLRDLVPLIIPPVLDKSRFFGLKGIRAQWLHAQGALQEADEVVVLGFSMPETDLSVRFMLQQVLARSNATILVVLKDLTELVKERYRGLCEEESRISFLEVPAQESSVDVLWSYLKDHA